jgi:hypothetical protein
VSHRSKGIDRQGDEDYEGWVNQSYFKDSVYFNNTMYKKALISYTNIDCLNKYLDIYHYLKL